MSHAVQPSLIRRKISHSRVARGSLTSARLRVTLSPADTLGCLLGPRGAPGSFLRQSPGLRGEPRTASPTAPRRTSCSWALPRAPAIPWSVPAAGIHSSGRRPGAAKGAQTRRHQRVPGHRPDGYQLLLQDQGFGASFEQALSVSALPQSLPPRNIYQEDFRNYSYNSNQNWNSLNVEENWKHVPVGKVGGKTWLWCKDALCHSFATQFCSPACSSKHCISSSLNAIF